MLKIYAKREEEMRLLPLLAEFKARVVTSFPIKGVTRKISGKNAYKVVNYPNVQATTRREIELEGIIDTFMECHIVDQQCDGTCEVTHSV